MSKRVRTTRRLEVWLKDASVALFVLNVQRRLVFFNVGCEKLTGWTAADVLGQVCHYVTESDSHSPAALLASLAAPADAWNGQSTTTPVRLARREREPLSCLIQFDPLTDPENKVQAVLGIIRESASVTAAPPLSKSQQVHLELSELQQSLRQRFTEHTVFGRSPAMRRVLEQLELAQRSALPVLFIGEPGTGRQHFARQVHYASERGRTAFVPLDCRRLPADHLTETLRRLSGPQTDETIQAGTAYFDRIEALPRELQTSLVELIESKGSARLRVMAASKRPLEEFVESDDIIRELYYALTPLTIFVPPLRNRPEDLEPLAQFFLEELNRENPLQVQGFHDEVWQQFQRYDWPGNVQELRQVIAEARQQCTGALIEVSHLPFRFRTGVDRQTIGPPMRKRTVQLDPLLLQVEREQIELALVEARHNKAKAADLLGITRPRLYRRMEVLGIVDNDESEASEPENP
jgi:DNA-binding NtrC family response regulator